MVHSVSSGGDKEFISKQASDFVLGLRDSRGFLPLHSILEIVKASSRQFVREYKNRNKGEISDAELTRIKIEYLRQTTHLVTDAYSNDFTSFTEWNSRLIGRVVDNIALDDSDEAVTKTAQNAWFRVFELAKPYIDLACTGYSTIESIEEDSLVMVKEAVRKKLQDRPSSGWVRV